MKKWKEETKLIENYSLHLIHIKWKEREKKLHENYSICLTGWQWVCVSNGSALPFEGSVFSASSNTSPSLLHIVVYLKNPKLSKTLFWLLYELKWSLFNLVNDETHMNIYYLLPCTSWDWRAFTHAYLVFIKYQTSLNAPDRIVCMQKPPNWRVCNFLRFTHTLWLLVSQPSSHSHAYFSHCCCKLATSQDD